MLFPIGPFHRLPLGGGAKAPAPFFPLSLPGLEEYYDGRSLTGANGSNINPWVDLSGHARNQGPSDPSTSLPTVVKPGSPKGVSLARFTIPANSALVSGTINPFPAATLGWTYYFYGNYSGSAGAATPWSTSQFGSAPKEISLVRSNKTGWRDSGGFHLPISPNVTGLHQIAYVFTPPSGTGTCQMYVDGVATGTPAVWTIAGATADTTQLGNTENFNTPMTADIGHIIWYSRAHTAAQVAFFHLWAQIYFGF